MMFDWKRDVPIWAMLKWQKTFPTSFHNPVMTGWKPTPKGGKFSYSWPSRQTATMQIYK